MNINISEFFEQDDVLAYIYPSSQDFTNLVPGTIESTVSGRTMVYPGNKKLVFQNACRQEVIDLLQKMNVDTGRQEDIVSLDVNPLLTGPERTEELIYNIKKLRAQGKIAGNLMGGQPFLGLGKANYPIDKQILYKLNTKDFMSQWLPEKYIPTTIAKAEDGKIFSLYKYGSFPKRFRVKLDSSSAGDGVRYVDSAESFAAVQNLWRDVQMPVIVQEEIFSQKNLCVNFGITPEGEGKIIGYSEQQTSEQGEFLGSRVTNVCQDLDPDIIELFEKYVFPSLKDLWRYGIGALDILRCVDTGDLKIIDPNLRFNASTNFLVDKINGNIGSNNVRMFSGTLRGTRSDFEKNVIRLVQDGILRVLALSEFDEDGQKLFSFQAGVLYDQEESLSENIQQVNSSQISANL